VNPTLLQLLYTFETTIQLSLVTIGVYVALKILRFPDLTAEGGFGLAGLTGGMAMTSTGSPWIGLTVSIATGACTGIVTACLANFARLPTLLASILTMTMCFSAGLLIAGQPSKNLADLWVLKSLLPWNGSPLVPGIFGTLILLFVMSTLLLIFLRTGAGVVLCARGENPDLVREMGHSLAAWDIVGLALANGFVGLGAALASQRAGYASINMGRGIAVYAFAAIMLSEAIFPARSRVSALTACVLGTLVLQLVRLVGLNLGLPEGSLDLVTSALVIVLCYLGKSRRVLFRNTLEKIRL
jgi:putative ABC transport system permease protein